MGRYALGSRRLVRSKEWQKAIEAAMEEESGRGPGLCGGRPVSRKDVSRRKDQESERALTSSASTSCT